MSKVIFLDRDGVINYDFGYVYKIEDFVFIKGVIEALKILTNLGFRIAVVTNQSGIGRNMYSIEDMNNVHNYMCLELKKHDIFINTILFCPHLDFECNCRKPKPGLILKGLLIENGDTEKSWIVGDKISDCLAGWSAGLKNLCLIANKDMPFVMPKTIVFKNLLSFAKYIRKLNENENLGKIK